MELKLVKVLDLDLKMKNRVDEFILDKNSTGEFINTINYLSYHPVDRFIDDSIVILDESSGEIKCVVMAASIKDDPKTVISHPGTTFSGPIFKGNQLMQEVEVIVDLILNYYELRYSTIDFKLQPTIYSTQPVEEIAYLLMKKGFNYRFTALANVINLAGLRNEEDIFKGYQPRKRSQIRKIIRNTTYTMKIYDSIDEELWCALNSTLEERYKVLAVHTFEEITDLKSRFPKHIIPYVAFRGDGDFGAFALVFKFKNVFHTQYLYLNYQLKNEHPNTLLNHQLIKTALEEGFTFFSFGASTESGGEVINQGLSHFKKKFGGGRILLPLMRKAF